MRRGSQGVAQGVGLFFVQQSMSSKQNMADRFWLVMLIVASVASLVLAVYFLTR